MPGLTNSQFLPYQLGADRRCDAPEVWASFLSTFEDRYRPILNLINRLDSVPMAMVERRTPYSIELEGSPGGPVVFDTVVFDTDGMVNLDSDPTLITPQRPGYYWGYGLIRQASVDVGTSDLAGSVQNGYAGNTAANDSDNPSNITFDPLVTIGNNLAIDIITSSGHYWNPAAVGAGLPSPFRLTKSGSNTVAYNFAQLAVYWIRDV